MNNDKMNVKKPLKESVLWLIMVLLTSAAFFGTYFYHLTTSMLALMWSGWFLLIGSSFFFTEKGMQVFAFAKESKLELEKVVWPSRQETTQTTMIVVVMVTVTGFVLWGIDSGMLWAIGKITYLG